MENHQKFHEEMFFFLSYFFPQPWYAIPPKKATVKHFLCKGWTCETTNLPSHQTDEFDQLIDGFIDGKYPEGLEKKMAQYISRGYYPAYCAAGFFAMIGTAGIKQNFTKSYELLKKGAEHDFWACYDILSFHPMTQNRTENVKKAVEKGAIWSTIYDALTSENKTYALELLIHVTTSETSGWWKRRRSGTKYAESVASILNMNDKNKTEAWETLKHLANNGNLPAAIWVADGYRTGEIGVKSAEIGINIMMPFISNGPWKMDLIGLLDTKDVERKDIIVDIASKIGQSSAEAISSFADPLLI